MMMCENAIEQLCSVLVRRDAMAKLNLRQNLLKDNVM
jgi:hypothetical protein